MVSSTLEKLYLLTPGVGGGKDSEACLPSSHLCKEPWSGSGRALPSSEVSQVNQAEAEASSCDQSCEEASSYQGKASTADDSCSAFEAESSGFTQKELDTLRVAAAQAAALCVGGRASVAGRFAMEDNWALIQELKSPHWLSWRCAKRSGGVRSLPLSFRISLPTVAVVVQ